MSFFLSLYHQLRGGPSLAMGWRNLLFENYPVNPETLRGLLPDPLTLDTFRDQAWVSVVPFRNVSLRPAGFSRTFGFDLPELNVRTYVTHRGTKGVYFFSLDAQGILSVLGARLFHRLPYFYARISLEDVEGTFRFTSQRYHPGAHSAKYRARYRPTGNPTPATRDPLSEFLVERYCFFTTNWRNRVLKTEVEHEPWRVSDVSLSLEENTLLEASDISPHETDPICFYSDGLNVRASGCHPVR